LASKLHIGLEQKKLIHFCGALKGKDAVERTSSGSEAMHSYYFETKCYVFEAFYQ